MKRRLVLTSALAALVAGSAAPLMAAPKETARDLFAGAWLFYRSAFVQADGRVIDNANGDISHSEGQGYGMLLAVAANDRSTFERMWKWTRDNLMVRDDALAAWKWDPNSDPFVTDTNNASDGDLLIAWALLRAYRLWSEPGYFAAARTLTQAITAANIIEFDGFTYLLPGAEGFVGDEPAMGMVVNLSYWVFPALAELQVLAPEFPADRLILSGLKLAQEARIGTANLPADWSNVSADGVTASDQFPTTFGYNAIRIPLYLSWYGAVPPALLEPYAALWSRIPEPSVIDLASGKAIDRMYDPGYRAIVNLLGCAGGKSPTDDPAQTLEMERYYPSTLSMLSLLAMVERYPQCLDAP